MTLGQSIRARSVGKLTPRRGVWRIVSTDGEDTVLVDFAALGCSVVDEIGTGPAALQIVAPADLFQRSRARARLIILRVSSTTDQNALRSTVAAALNPDAAPTGPLLQLQYQLDSVTYSLLVYFAPEKGDLDRNDGSLLLRFVSYDAAWTAASTETAPLSMLSSLSGVGYVLLRSSAGVWSAPAGGPAEDVTALHYSTVGGGVYLYAGTSAGKVWRWDGLSWLQLGAALGSDAVVALLVAPDGTLYAGGATTNQVDRWDGSAWSAVGALGGVCFALSIGPDGLLYAATTAAGYVKKWTGAAWATAGSGLSQYVQHLALGPDGLLYAGWGGGVVRLSASVWTAIDATMDVTSLYFLEDGRLIAGHTGGAGIWNGVSWSDLVVNGEVYSLAPSPRGLLMIGAFTAAGGVALWSPSAIWRGGTFFSGEHALDSHRDAMKVAALSNGALAIGLQLRSPGAATAYTSRHHAISIVGSSSVYPSIELSYPNAYTVGAVHSIVNLTSGDELHFAGLGVIKGEVVTIDCRGIITSDYRGDLSSTVRAGSRALRLLPGVANELLVNGDTLLSAILSYAPKYVTLDSIDG